MDWKDKSIGVPVFLPWLLLVSAPVLGQDGSGWPQFRGPNVDGVSIERGVLSEGPVRLEVAWKRLVGEGMSAVSVVNDLAVTMTIVDESVWVHALDAGTGAERWRHEVAPVFPSPDGTYDGPMSTPLIADRIVVGVFLLEV